MVVCVLSYFVIVVIVVVYTYNDCLRYSIMYIVKTLNKMTNGHYL